MPQRPQSRMQLPAWRPTSSSLKKPNETATTWAVVISLLCRLDCMAPQSPSQGAQGFLSATHSGPPVHCTPKSELL